MPPSQLASIFEEMSNPDLEAATDFRRESVETLKNVNSIFDLIVTVDRKSEFNEGDYWAQKLENIRLIDIDESDNIALEDQRVAFLKLRRNDLEGVFTIAKKLHNGPQHSRALGLAAIAHFAKDESEAALEDMINAMAGRDDLSWLKKIAEGYFKRYNRDKLEDFLTLVDEATQSG